MPRDMRLDARELCDQRLREVLATPKPELVERFGVGGRSEEKESLRRGPRSGEEFMVFVTAARTGREDGTGVMVTAHPTTVEVSRTKLVGLLRALLGPSARRTAMVHDDVP